MTLWVPGQLPGMNELIAAAKGQGGRGYAYAKLKRQWTQTIVLLCKAARLPHLPCARLQFEWREKARHRDPDNVAAGGRKLILDGLVEAGVLPGDGWDYVLGWEDTFVVDKNPGVKVELVVP